MCRKACLGDWGHIYSAAKVKLLVSYGILSEASPLCYAVSDPNACLA